MAQTLYLRGCWRVDKLHFDADGQPEKHYETTAPTEAAFKATSVKLHGDRLQIEGQRIVVAFDRAGTASLIPWVSKNYNGKMKIDVAGTLGGDFGKALDTIFSPELIHPAVRPSESKPQNSGTQPQQPGPGVARDAKTDTGGPNTTPTAGVDKAVADAAKPKHIGGTIRPPIVLQSAEPEFSEAARALKYSANVQVYLWVNEAGMPSHVKVVRPVGMGLDEQAIAAVQQYRFKPATRDGVPVKVDLYIDVNFQIF